MVREQSIELWQIRLANNSLVLDIDPLKNGLGLLSSDGKRLYRFPKWKPDLGKTQANFQQWATPSRGAGEPYTNGHLDVQ